mmetsp:Transcript_58205/g.87744  ORF Transcript_58205/g.87744 Transcript_58205/m.87744 type:complete len:306 (-) Transcript_58205:1265-2182(-)|eukprot:CAMPEP_0117019302 /NCGR_PEP_ID=MMETSP0472-20121206/14835_1 /TAXON_ID=693140 ORGANISM="Tiarina fusus, Strain LIS" /NCGR_SAMPLE_ID=MMETSP0472 /ASSEMBLY_ACC=CAM_ASM_000603 /LENGTH=305 /DNA_ID=CAMNT_0004724241 /DNA_START=346 /DNA_END=1263 /DNA_ORIENTATION=+
MAIFRWCFVLCVAARCSIKHVNAFFNRASLSFHANYVSSSSTTSLLHAKKGKKNKKKQQKPSSSSSPSPRLRPRLIVFDLDGCLWKPELFELMFPARSDFVVSNNDDDDDDNDNGFFAVNPNEQPLPGTTLTTPSYQRLELLGATRSILHELCYDEEWLGTLVGISSRTDRPDWAYEAMRKFVLYQEAGGGGGNKKNNTNNGRMTPIATMQDVFTPQLCILDRNRNKADQFETLQKDSGHFTGRGRIRYRDMLFFDNEAGNCKQVANLGVTTVYCPQGVTRSAWEEGIQNFPTSSGKVLGQKMPY